VGWNDWFSTIWQKLGRATGPAAAKPSVSEATEDHPLMPSISLPTGTYELRVGVVSTTGNVREHNEDNYYVPGRPSLRVAPAPETASWGAGLGGGAGGGGCGVTTVEQPPDQLPPASNGLPGLFLVADGMGGQLAGEKASEMAVEIVPGELKKRLSAIEDDEKALKRAIRDAVAEANKEILAQSHLVTEFANMGTTIVLALFRGDRAYITGIGDSRAYRLRDNRLERLTTDHSLADALASAGTIKPEEAENHKFRHVLYLYLGCKDARDGPEEIRAVDVRRGDRFLLASDGLTGVVRDSVIAEVLLACEDPQRAAQALINRALENRSKDNITCVVIQVV
jgi:serine/threonine protein phosphatase PrpC